MSFKDAYHYDIIIDKTVPMIVVTSLDTTLILFLVYFQLILMLQLLFLLKLLW